MMRSFLFVAALLALSFVKLPGEPLVCWAFNDRATDVDEQASFDSGSIDQSPGLDHRAAPSDTAQWIEVSASVESDALLKDDEANVPTSENHDAIAEVPEAAAAASGKPDIANVLPPVLENAEGPKKIPAEVAEFLGDAPVKQVKKYTIAQVNILDMLSARTTMLTIPVGKSRAFDTLMVAVTTCQDTLETGTYQAFLNITERRIGKVEQQVFSGWMFSDSFSLSSMENPSYDVTLVGCK
jgi:hypothetical protein